jgi:ATP-binding cassette subfamily B protein
MKSLNELDEDLTLLMIAHRLTTLKNCNKIIELDVSDGLKETQYDKIIQ